MLTEYITTSMNNAIFKTLEDGSIYGSIPGFQGVWANANSKKECQKELKEVLEDWILFKTRRNHVLPVVNNLDLNPTSVV